MNDRIAIAWILLVILGLLLALVIITAALGVSRHLRHLRKPPAPRPPPSPPLDDDRDQPPGPGRISHHEPPED